MKSGRFIFAQAGNSQDVNPCFFNPLWEKPFQPRLRSALFEVKRDCEASVGEVRGQKKQMVNRIVLEHLLRVAIVCEGLFTW
jgi:hypothetical protein